MIDFLKEIIRYKWIVCVLTGLFFTASLLWALNTPNEYQAQVMLMPVDDESQGGLGLSGQLGGLASIAGLNMGGGANNKIELARELINDWSFSDGFIRENNLKVYLLAVTGWDKGSNSFIYDEDIYDSEKQQWRTIDGQSQEPSDWRAFNELKKRVAFRKEKSGTLIFASFDYYSPELSQLWLSKLILAINHKIQVMDMTETKKSIDYLNGKIQSTSISEMQTVFYQLLQEQMKKLMLAEIREEYILKKVGPIKQPEDKFKPRRVVMILLGTIFGFLLSLLLISLKPVYLKLKSSL